MRARCSSLICRSNESSSREILFFSPYEGQQLGFAQETTQEFAARIRALGFNVDKLAGVHGKTGTMSELDEALELAKKVDSRPVTEPR